MEEVETSAKTVDEAVALALAQLGARREEVEVTILSEGRAGILGLGAEDAQVRVRRRQPERIGTVSEEAELAEGILGQLLELLGVKAEIHRLPRPQERATNITSEVILDVQGDNLGLLIGRGGETLGALQYLVTLIVSRRLKARVNVAVDVASYRLRREEMLRGLALRMAERVKSTGQAITLEPMPPSERRIVHLALQGHPEVLTQSLGEEMRRQVVIAPRFRSRPS